MDTRPILLQGVHSWEFQNSISDFRQDTHKEMQSLNDLRFIGLNCLKISLCKQINSFAQIKCLINANYLQNL